MALGEGLFDISYLAVVLSLGFAFPFRHRQIFVVLFHTDAFFCAPLVNIFVQLYLTHLCNSS